jgi:hypothetical protein
MKVASWGLMLLLITPLPAAAARPQQDQSEDPLVAAARRAREEKKDQPKATKVYDNDSLPSTPDGINVVGQESAPAADSATTENPPAAKPADAAGIQSSLAEAKAQLDSLKTDLDIMQRKYALDEQMYLSKPEYSSDKAGTAAMQDEKDQIEAKQQAIADAEKKVADLQAKLDQAVSSKAK